MLRSFSLRIIASISLLLLCLTTFAAELEDELITKNEAIENSNHLDDAKKPSFPSSIAADSLEEEQTVADDAPPVIVNGAMEGSLFHLPARIRSMTAKHESDDAEQFQAYSATRAVTAAVRFRLRSPKGWRGRRDAVLHYPPEGIPLVEKNGWPFMHFRLDFPGIENATGLPTQATGNELGRLWNALFFCTLRTVYHFYNFGAGTRANAFHYLSSVEQMCHAANKPFPPDCPSRLVMEIGIRRRIEDAEKSKLISSDPNSADASPPSSASPSFVFEPKWCVDYTTNANRHDLRDDDNLLLHKYITGIDVHNVWLRGRFYKRCGHASALFSPLAAFSFASIFVLLLLLYLFSLNRSLWS